MQRNWLKMNIQNFLRISHVQWVTGNVVSVQHLMLHVEANQGVTGNVVSVQQRKMNIQNFLPISHVQWVTGNVVSVQHLMLHVEANQGITRKMSTNVFIELSRSISWKMIWERFFCFCIKWNSQFNTSQSARQNQKPSSYRCFYCCPPSASSDKQFSARERREKLGRGGGKPNSKPPDIIDRYGIDIAECLRKSNRPRWGTQTFKIIQTKYGHYSCVISGLKVYS